MTRQLSIGPVVGSSADWMSAAEVPGAKLLPTTTNGPEAPLMESPLMGCRIVACAFPDSSALRRRSALCCFLFAGFARVRADATVAGAGFGLGLLVWFGRKDAEAERFMTKVISSEICFAFEVYERLGLMYLWHADPAGQAPGLRGRRLAHRSGAWCTCASILLVSVFPQ
jgi:hypothetical protein